MAQYNGKTKAHLKDHDTNDFGHLHITDRTTDPKQTPFEFGEKCHGIVVKEAFKSSSKNKLTRRDSSYHGHNRSSETFGQQ